MTLIFKGIPSQTIALSGTGVSSPSASLSASSLSFGGQQVGTQSASKSLTLKNIGSFPLQIVSVQITGPNASSFVFGNDCPASLGPSNSCSIHGHFAREQPVPSQRSSPSLTTATVPKLRHTNGQRSFFSDSIPLRRQLLFAKQNVGTQSNLASRGSEK